jgi:hypothetical protein
MIKRQMYGPAGFTLPSHLPQLRLRIVTTGSATEPECDRASAGTVPVCGAPYGVPGPDRINVRNGYRHRDFDTWAGIVDATIPIAGGLSR